MSAAPRVPFADLSLQWHAIREAARPEIDALFESSAFVLGPYVQRFEQAVAKYLGANHAVGVNSGTSALHLALIAAGIGRGDKVLVPAMTFIATVWPLLYLGAVPVLCDVDRATGTIDVADAEKRLDAKVKAIMPVHLYGQPADMKAVRELAARHGLKIIEDAAQSIGARFGGVATGCIGDIGCFSFYPGKNLGAAGEGGLVTVRDEQTAARLRSLRHHAQTERYIHGEIGFNYRMEGIQGLILFHKLVHLDAWTAQRRRVAARYLEGLADLPLGLPKAVNQDHVYHLFVVRSPQRDALKDHLAGRGIETGLHYPVPIQRQPCMKEFGLAPDAYPVADEYARQGLSLPIYAGMPEEQVDLVIGEVRGFFRQGRSAAGRAG